MSGGQNSCPQQTAANNSPKMVKNRIQNTVSYMYFINISF